MLHKPEAKEYRPYFGKYIDLIPEGDVPLFLKEQMEQTLERFCSLTEEQGNYRYAPGKWSVKQVVGHIADTERVMSYRLLRIARGDVTPLAGFDEDLFANHAPFERMSLNEVLDELAAVRQATLALVRPLQPEAWERIGLLDGHETSARALAYILAGHGQHHRNVIEQRYLSTL